MANSTRLRADVTRATRVPARDQAPRLLRTDPAIPRTLVTLALSSGESGGASLPRQLADVPPPADRARPLRPRRLPSAIAVEMAPNLVYRRYPLVTSLLVEIDELRRAGALPPLRRGR